MSSADEMRREQAWSSYWASGRLHSCLGSYQGNYEGVIGAFWATVSDLVLPGQRVLDLATGNGPIPLLLWTRHGPSAGLRIDAVDLAQVAPTWHSSDAYPGITFHSGTRLEQLPFESQSFDWIVSQFGIEYSDHAKAVSECLRVTAEGAGVAFVLHHAESVLLEVARAELAHQRLLTSPSGLLECAMSILPWLARARSGVDLQGNLDALQARQMYNEAITVLAKHISTDRAPDLLIETRDYIHDIVAGVCLGDIAARQRAIENCAESLAAASVRSSELIACALSEEQMEAFISPFRAAWPEKSVRCEPLRQAEGLLGWSLLICNSATR